MRNFLTSLDKNRIRNNAGNIGDWRYDDEHIYAMSAIMEDRRSELAIQIHELVESFLCREAGITDKEVTAFDAMFEEERAKGLHTLTDEAGDDARAPYLDAHQAATVVEKEVCNQLGLAWSDHSDNVNALFTNA